MEGLLEFAESKNVKMILTPLSMIMSLLAACSYFVSKLRPHPATIMIMIFITETFSTLFTGIWGYNPNHIITYFDLDIKLMTLIDK
jgi:hypothetical protein